MKNNSQETRILNQTVGDGGFLQSEIWREFQERTGHSTVHWENDEWLANGIEFQLPLVGKYGYMPRGPVLKEGIFPKKINKTDWKTLFDEAYRRKWGWLRIEPEGEKILSQVRSELSKRVVPAPHSVQPREILVMDIEPEPEVILNQMKPKTRYNIRLAERKGVKVFQTHEKRYQEAFIRLVGVTAERDGIRPHPKKHYEAMFETFPAENWELFVAEFQEEIIAVNLVVFFGEYATYLHGASANEYREVMAPYLLQWSAIEEARSRWCRWYDFGGVDTLNQNKGWSGITRFKTGFAPFVPTRHFPGAFDIVLSPWRYQFYLWLRMIQKWKKSLM